MACPVLSQSPPPDALPSWKTASQCEKTRSYPGQRKDLTVSIKTDENWSAPFPLIRAGPYVIRLIHMEWVKKPTHKWRTIGPL